MATLSQTCGAERSGNPHPAARRSKRLPHWHRTACDRPKGKQAMEWALQARRDRTLVWADRWQSAPDRNATEFNRLVADWKSHAGASSLVMTTAMQPAYQQMMAMGREILPLVFERIVAEPDEAYQWFWALAAITRENPVPAHARGDIRAMAEAWLAWGRAQGYVSVG